MKKVLNQLIGAVGEPQTNRDELFHRGVRVGTIIMYPCPKSAIMGGGVSFDASVTHCPLCYAVLVPPEGDTVSACPSATSSTKS